MHVPRGPVRAPLIPYVAMAGIKAAHWLYTGSCPCSLWLILMCAQLLEAGRKQALSLRVNVA